MSELFLYFFNASVSASYIVLAVLVLRLILKRAPKWSFVLLWAIVAIKLIFPLSIESDISLIPSAEMINPDVLVDTPQINTGFPIINNTLNPIIQESTFEVAPEKSVNTLKIFILVFSRIWIIGIICLLLYTLISYIKLRKQVSSSDILYDNIYNCKTVSSPFVLGIFKPRIYIPFMINECDIKHVIAHEQAHIQRKDHLWKPLGFFILTLHWFNPILWIAYILFCRDIEFACDEKVIKNLDRNSRADYSQALLSCSIRKISNSVCPIAFGEVGVKKRIKTVLTYKKPAFWIVICTFCICIILAACSLTNPSEHSISPEKTQIHTDYEGVYILKESILKDDNNTLFNIVWHNTTSKEIVFGESYTIERKEGERWIDTKIEEKYFNTIGLILNANESIKKTYSTEGFDISKSGTYRLLVTFSVKTRNGHENHQTWIEFIVGEIQSLSHSLLKEKYPNFYDLNTQNGLTVYIWQLSDINYGCYLVSSDMDNLTDHSFAFEKGATLIEMAAIVSGYEIDLEKITIKPVINPISSFHYEINEEYTQSLEKLFKIQISYLDFSSVYDYANFDIDNDGALELCTITPGYTSGVFTFRILAREEESGKIKYRTTYYSDIYTLSFIKGDDGTVKVQAITRTESPETHIFDISIVDDRICLTENDVPIGYATN